MSRGAIELGEKLRKWTKPPDVAEDGEVTAVDESNYTCTVKLATGLPIEDVHLKALKGATKGIIVLPKVGSHVQIINLGEPDWLVVAFEEVDKVIVKAGVKVELDCDEIIINGGSNEGLAIIAKLVTQYNKIEKDINTLKTAFKSWIPSSGDGGAALKGAAGGWFGQNLQSTTKDDIENPKVKH